MAEHKIPRTDNKDKEIETLKKAVALLQRQIKVLAVKLTAANNKISVLQYDMQTLQRKK